MHGLYIPGTLFYYRLCMYFVDVADSQRCNFFHTSCVRVYVHFGTYHNSWQTATASCSCPLVFQILCLLEDFLEEVMKVLGCEC